MRFFKRVGGLQHQSLQNDDTDNESLQRKPSEESRTTSTASTPSTNARIQLIVENSAAEKGNELESSFRSSASSNMETKEPVWKRRYRAHQASLPHETRNSSAILVLKISQSVKTEPTDVLGDQLETVSGFSDPWPTTEGELVQTNAFDQATEGHRIEQIEELVTNQEEADEEQDDFDEDGSDDISASNQRYSQAMNEASGEFYHSSSVQNYSNLQPPKREEVWDETASWEEYNPPKSTSGLLNKMMNSSFRKSVMASKKKAWKTVVACHRPSLDKVEPQQEDTIKTNTASDVPLWKRLGTNILFSSTKETNDVETSFESVSSNGTEEILTYLKRAGTTLTGFVKETTAACTHPQHEEDDAVSLDEDDDQSSNGSYDSRTVGESRASTTKDYYFEGDNENNSMEDEAGNSSQLGGCQTLPGSLKNAVSMMTGRSSNDQGISSQA